MSDQLVVWLVTAEGVYDHGVYYVGTTLAEAEAFSHAHSMDNDGYHDWRIERHVVGEISADLHPKHDKTRVTYWPEDLAEKENYRA